VKTQAKAQWYHRRQLGNLTIREMMRRDFGSSEDGRQTEIQHEIQTGTGISDKTTQHRDTSNNDLTNI